METSSVHAELPRFEHPAKEDDSLSFLVIGDWGRRGGFKQPQVAFQMGKVGEKLDIDFVISTGDNFYDKGLMDVYDTAFVESFTNVYTAKSLQKQWYSVLGNHDYQGDVDAQLSPDLKKIDSRWLCLRSFIVNAEIVDFFFVDTTPFVKMYLAHPRGNTYDWRGVGSTKTYTENLLNVLESELSKSTAGWKIVVGHHGIRSVGHHGDTDELVERLLPVLQAHNVDFYINGHDHCLEHMADDNSSIQFFTSGAGSMALKGAKNGLNRTDLNFFHDGEGFMSVQLTRSDAKIVFYDVSGDVLHRWSTSKQLHSSVSGFYY